MAYALSMTWIVNSVQITESTLLYLKFVITTGHVVCQYQFYHTFNLMHFTFTFLLPNLTKQTYVQKQQ